MAGRLRTYLDPYIGLMLLTVLLATLLPARGTGAQITDGAADAAIVVLFFLYGARLAPDEAMSGLANWRLQLGVVLCTYVLFPALGFMMATLLQTGLPTPLLTGVLVLCLLPSTVQSSIAFTSIAGGNVPAALFAASASNILGVFITPLLAGLLLHAGGASVSFDVLQDIILQLLLPFFAGQMLRRWIGGWVTRHKRVLGYVDRGSILLIIYVAFAKGVVDHIWSALSGGDLALLFVILIVLLALVLTLTGLTGRKLMRLSMQDEIVLQFCGSKKSLASGLPMATVLFPGGQVGMIVLPIMIFHQVQLIVCAILARHYAERTQAAKQGAEPMLPPMPAQESA